MISEQLQRKIYASIKLLRSIQAAHPYEVIEVAYSGGKDSDVILQLAKEAGINYEAIYKNTTIDPPGTIKHAQEMGCTIMQPRRYTFRQLIERKGMPSRFRRFCCEELKEYKVRDVSIIGVRREESKNRAEIYKEPTKCRFYGSKKEHVEAIYPILEWNTQDVADFLQDRGIKCAPIYYDEHGVFHPERRLGCMCCPMASRKKRIEQFKQYKGMVKLYINAEQKFIDTHPNSASAKIHNNSAIECFVRDVFCENAREFEMIKSGMFGEPDFKKYLEDYFDIKL